MCMKAPAWFRKAIGQDAPSYWAAWQRAALRAERVLAAPDGWRTPRNGKQASTAANGDPR